jgi:hypothetical protein
MVWYAGVLASKRKHDKTLVIDFDGTIAEDKYPYIGKALPGAKEAIRKLKDAGYEIVIFSCRTTKNDGKPEAEVAEQKERMADWMRENDIPFDRIEDGRDGKPHCLYFVDNKALHYGGNDDWESICQYILSK